MQSNSRLFYFVASVVFWKANFKEATINLTSSQKKGVGMLMSYNLLL